MKLSKKGRAALVLAASMFTMAPAANAGTVAYWQFDNDDLSPSDGTIEPSVGAAATYTLTRTNHTVANELTSSTSQFGPTIPHPDTTPGFTGTPSTNNGSILSVKDKSSYLTAAAGSDVGFNLVNNTWTMEGWFQLGSAPTQGNPTADSNFNVLFNTRSAKGILFDVRLKSGDPTKTVFNLFVAGSTAANASANTPNVQFTPSTGSISTGEYHHYALTYDSAAGTNGRFEVFYDGTSVGTYDFTSNITQSSVDGGDLGLVRLAGRGGTTNSFGGNIDEWRLSDTVLTPSQMLIPEPASAGLFGMGGLLLLARRRQSTRGR
jgi:hypothetical protein